MKVLKSNFLSFAEKKTEVLVSGTNSKSPRDPYAHFRALSFAALGGLVSPACGEGIIHLIPRICSWLWALGSGSCALHKVSRGALEMAHGNNSWGPGHFPLTESRRPDSVDQNLSEPIS